MNTLSFFLRGISLLFQAPEVPGVFRPLFVIEKAEWDGAKQSPLAPFALDAKFSMISIMIKIYQGVFSKKFLGIEGDIIEDIKLLLQSQKFLHMNQQKLLEYLDYINARLEN